MPETELRRELGLFEVTLYGVGLILGAGIYTVIGEAAGMAGESLPLAFLLSALIAAFTGLSYAELSTMFPEEGAEYVYTLKAFGSEKLSSFVAIMRILVGVISGAAVSLAFASYLSSLVPIPLTITAIALIVVASCINFYGIKLSADFNVLFTIVEILGLIIIIALGLLNWNGINVTQFPQNFKGLFNGAFLVFFAYIGFQSLVNISEETRDAKKTIPRAMILSIVITTGLYIAVAACTLTLANWQALAESSAPLAFAAAEAMGPKAFFILTVIALFSTTNTVLISLISSSRMLYGSAKKRYTFPEIFSKVHSVTRTPYFAVLGVMLISIAFALIGDISIVANITNFGLLSVFVIINLSLIWIKLKKPNIESSFSSPLDYNGFPVTSIMGMVTSFLFVLFYLIRNFI